VRYDHVGVRTPETTFTIKPERAPLAKTNYSFEKRQREIAKKKKQDSKQAKKTASRDSTSPQLEARTSPPKGA